MNDYKRFVVAEHRQGTVVHWDFMLEAERVLHTWRVGVGPAEIDKGEYGAERIADHPLRFLTYEGPVQNNTGSVKIADCGKYLPLDEQSGRIEFELDGKILNGRFTLEQVKNAHWILRKTA
jgi:bifunctional non-homologous end joining protein LigD